MDAIVTLLETDHSNLIAGIWKDLQSNCGLRGIEATPIPHFSWIVAESLEQRNVETDVADLAREIRPFSVRTAGIGIFQFPEPVLFLAVSKNKALLELHERIWGRLSPLGMDLNPYYSPEFWVPHITLAQWDLTNESIGCAVGHLISQDLTLDMPVDNLAVLNQEEGQAGTLLCRYEFTG